jgi:transposase
MKRMFFLVSKRRVFSVEYKKEIIKLVAEQGKKASQVAKDIRVNEATVRRWVKEHGVHGNDAFPGKDKLRPDDEEIRYKFIYENSPKFGVEKMCKVLDFKRGSYYAWLKRTDAKRKIEDSILTIEIKRVNISL